MFDTSKTATQYNTRNTRIQHQPHNKPHDRDSKLIPTEKVPG